MFRAYFQQNSRLYLYLVKATSFNNLVIYWRISFGYEAGVQSADVCGGMQARQFKQPYGFTSQEFYYRYWWIHPSGM